MSWYFWHVLKFDISEISRHSIVLYYFRTKNWGVVLGLKHSYWRKSEYRPFAPAPNVSLLLNTLQSLCATVAFLQHCSPLFLYLQSALQRATFLLVFNPRCLRFATETQPYFLPLGTDQNYIFFWIFFRKNYAWTSHLKLELLDVNADSFSMHTDSNSALVSLIKPELWETKMEKPLCTMDLGIR